MTKWFRFYADAMRNPKVAALSDREFRLWVQLLSVASENEGRLPPAAELKHMLNTRLDHLLTGLKRLITAGLIDALERGYEPHNWSKFQYRSDTSTDRVRKHRAERNVSETPPEEEQIQKQKIEPRAQQTRNAARPFFYDRLQEAASARGPCNPNLALGMAPMTDLVRQGYSEDEIVEAVRDRASPGITSWRYFVPIVIQRAKDRAAIVPKPSASAPVEDWPARVAAWRADPGNWIHAWGPKPDERGTRVPAELMQRTAA